MTEKLGRDGRVSKHAITRTIPPHNGMSFRDSIDGTHYVSISKTQAAHPLDDEPNIHEPKIAKRGLAQVGTHPAQALRGMNRAQRSDGQGILDEALSHEERCDLGSARFLKR